jgi:hypothetical protein
MGTPHSSKTSLRLRQSGRQSPVRACCFGSAEIKDFLSKDIMDVNYEVYKISTVHIDAQRRTGPGSL